MVHHDCVMHHDRRDARIVACRRGSARPSWARPCLRRIPGAQGTRRLAPFAPRLVSSRASGAAASRTHSKCAAHFSHSAGTGSCRYTVPYALWCAATYAGDYVEAVVETVSTGGDADTTCAIVGGIVVLSAGLESIPSTRVEACEPYRVEPVAAM